MGPLLSSRGKLIIDLLLLSLQPITMQQIAEEINVSRRTILREMPTVYKWFEAQGSAVEHHPKKGVFYPGDAVQRQRLKDALEEATIDQYYEPKERRTFVAVKLLQSNELYKLAYFSKILFVSEATISHDLDSLENEFNVYQLTLNRKPGLGVKIEGSEADKRKALINYIYHSLDGDDLRDAINYYMRSFTERSAKTKDIRSQLLDLIDVDTIKVIEQAIKQSEEDMGFKFAESSYTALAVHLTIALQRLQKGENIVIAEEALDNLQLMDEFVVAKRLANRLAGVLAITIPIEEIGYITMHLRGAKYHSGLVKSDRYQFNELMISNYQLASLINEMIKIAEEETGYPLKQSDSLLVGLVEHLRPAFNRLEMNLDIRNPLLDKIKSQYPDLFRISQKCADLVEKRMNLTLPESETGYIAMHIGSAIERIRNTRSQLKRVYRVVITCISGIGTSRMLAERVRSEFRNIDIVEVYSSTDINDSFLLENYVDLIISTVHFDNKLLPVVTVNPLLMDNDIERIKQKLLTLDILDKKPVYPKSTETNPLDILERLSRYSSAVGEMIETLRCIDHYAIETFDQFLDLIAENLTPSKSVAKKLKASIIERETIGQIIFEDEEVAVLHAKTEAMKRLHVAVFRTETSLIYKGKPVKTILVLIAPSNASKEAIEIISEISTKLVSDASFLNHLSRDSMDEIYAYIKAMLLSFLAKINRQLLG